MRRMHAVVAAATLGTGVLVGFTPAEADPGDDGMRWSGLVRGGLSVTGNTLGLSKAVGTQDLGIQDSIGAFLAPTGTTTDWHSNGSTAVLDLPAGSDVVHATLLWGGSFEYGGQDVYASLDDTVDLTSETGTAIAVSPDPATSLTIVQDGSPNIRYYRRSADVTEYVAEHGAGEYLVAGVPATNAAGINTQSAAGWSLGVVYDEPGAPLRYVALDLDTGWVDETSSRELTYDGFCTPDGGSPSALVVASAIEGDANRTGDQLLAGPDTGSLTPLFGANNPAGNFFASQLNDSSGALDTRGSGGTVNHDAANGINVTGGRQGWDVTTVVPDPDQLAAGQDGLALQARTDSDSYLPTLLGVQVDVGAPRPDLDNLLLSSASPRPGASTTLTVPFDNTTGTADAVDVRLALTVPKGLTLSSISVNGSVVPGAGLADGIGIGDVPVGSVRVVRLVLKATAAGSHLLRPTWSYDFDQCAGQPTSSEELTTAGTTLKVAPPPDRAAPQTRITQHPKSKGQQRTAVFGFRSTEPGSTFRCRLDRGSFKPCTSPRRYPVSAGKHTFSVYAVDKAGNADRSPATWRFSVSRRGR
jgi:hypothetical protein